MKNFIISICLLATSGVAFSQNKAENIAVDKVRALPETKSFMHTARKSQPELMVARKPDRDFNYYWIKVGLANLEQFRTSMDFYVDAKTGKIFYLDLITGDENGEQLLTLTQWRKWRKLPAWQQLHCFTGSGKNLKFKACDP
ncbi:MAG: hypothetical protein JKY70_05860 [Mucilaginibacter sp.]|nr:hypothetical protein [Mucilaginibacter sp.]